MKTKKLSCPNCGSNDINIINNDYCICNCCGTKLLLDNKPISITNNKIYLNADKTNNALPFYEINLSKTPEVFLRKSLIDLAINKETPCEIFNFNFDPVKIIYRKYAKIDMDIDISYTSSIGYDRQEKYKTFEKQYDYTTRKYESKEVQKTKTVTDWKSLNSSKSFSFTKGLCLDHYEFDENGEIPSIEKAFPNWVSKQKKKEFDAKNNVLSPEIPSENQIKYITDSCIKSAVEKCKSTLPGDRYRDFAWSAKSQKQIESFAVPQYVLQYRSNNKNYSIKSLAGDDYMTIVSYPSAKKKIMEHTTTQTRSLTISSFIALSASILMSFIFFVIALGGASQSTKNFGLFICFVLCLVAVVLGVNLLRKRDSATRDILISQQQQKLSNLRILLKKLNLADITSQEAEQIKNIGELK